MPDDELAEAAAEWTANEFSLDKYATVEEFLAAKHDAPRAPERR